MGGETYEAANGGRRLVLSVVRGLVAYRVVRRCGGQANRKGSEFGCSLPAFAAWAERRVA